MGRVTPWSRLNACSWRRWLGQGISGAALQGMMRNPLVGPYIVGVSSGAAFGGVLGMLFTLSPAGIVGLAFCGGLLAMLLTLGIAKLARSSASSLILVLAEVFVGAFFLALVGLIEFLVSDAQLPSMIYWLLGSFVGADPRKVFMIAIPTLGAGAVLMTLRWRINLLSLGDLDAKTLGVNVGMLRCILIVLVSMIVASQVAISGIVAWLDWWFRVALACWLAWIIGVCFQPLVCWAPCLFLDSTILLAPSCMGDFPLAPCPHCPERPQSAFFYGSREEKDGDVRNLSTECRTLIVKSVNSAVRN
jgi:hypothetical protein